MRRKKKKTPTTKEGGKSRTVKITMAIVLKTNQLVLSSFSQTTKAQAPENGSPDPTTPTNYSVYCSETAKLFQGLCHQCPGVERQRQKPVPVHTCPFKTSRESKELTSIRKYYESYDSSPRLRTVPLAYGRGGGGCLDLRQCDIPKQWQKAEGDETNERYRAESRKNDQ